MEIYYSLYYSFENIIFTQFCIIFHLAIEVGTLYVKIKKLNLKYVRI